MPDTDPRPETHNRINFHAAVDSPEYQLIEATFAGRYAERSGEAYMKHIDDGLDVLAVIGAHEITMRAWCLHPIVQVDEDLQPFLRSREIFHIDQRALVLAMEYRKVANAYLSRDYRGSGDKITLSPLKEVNQMLVADKVQNYHDFLIHHAETHPRARELEDYFHNWFRALGVDYAPLAAAIGSHDEEEK